MILADVNVLIYAHRRDAVDHERYRDWLEGSINGHSAFGVSELVLSSFLRVVTHPRIFDRPTRMDEALRFVESLRARPNAVTIAPGSRHWPIFAELCARAGVKGNLVPDAYLAALAIESGCEWITNDREYARFPGLTWRHPLD
jgi:toxin-antitoxin system PIN domain toxin